jgi:hypothetical protein
MMGGVLPSVRITDTDPNARHRDSNGCFGLVLAPLVALATLLLFRKRTR